MQNLILFILLILSSYLLSSQEDKIDNSSRTLIEKLNRANNKNLIRGFSVAVVNDMETLFEKGFGFADVDSAKQYTSKTTQPVASISKVLIGLSLIKAEEMNLLSLEEPVNKYLSFKVINPNYPNDEILIRHLAYHTSSIIDKDEIYNSQFFLEDEIELQDNEAEDYYDFFKKASEKKSLKVYLENAFSSSVDDALPFANSKPGEIREYSNIGSDLCALIIQNASKKDFRYFTVEHILNPLKMNNSSWRPENIQSKNRSRLFVTNDTMIPNYVQGSYPNGSFRSSSHDLGILLSELIRGYNGKGKVLSKEGYKRFYQKEKHDEEFYGCFIEYNNKWIRITDDMIGHDGSDPGVFTGMFFNPKRNTGKILISNTDTDYIGENKIYEEITMIWKSLIDYEIKLAKTTNK
ncbi:serine hydrolase domain-containing protein [Maribacter sp. 2307UL18-2]|uniref:serine hydrolase domain-containing protein n=1 Tax=Maribacter sp. 2307UL18-2 TaxID=3386274 RepID=UPI0039BCC251